MTTPSILPNSISSKQICKNGKFTSDESPIAFSESIKEECANITVITPFYSNANTKNNPKITTSYDSENKSYEIMIVPSYNSKILPSNFYTQLFKIQFTLNLGGNYKYDSATIKITVNEKRLSPGELGEPLRKTKIIVQSTDA